VLGGSGGSAPLYLSVNGAQYNTSGMYWAEATTSQYRQGESSTSMSIGTVNNVAVGDILEVRLNVDYYDAAHLIVKYDVVRVTASPVPGEHLTGFVLINTSVTQLGLFLGGSLLFTAASTWAAVCTNQY
jgi:hypothetical protein